MKTLRTFESIRTLNPHINIKPIDDESFRKYGRVIEGYDFTPIIIFLDSNSTIPDDGNVYVPSVEELEKLPVFISVEKEIYGSSSVQAGYCNGRNSTLNGLEYHKSSEINIAATEAVLLLGDVRDISDDFQYDSEKVEAFYLEAGQAIEMYATTLHFAPCKVHAGGFKVAVLLPKGTNLQLSEKPADNSGENRILFAVNKWLLAHPERKALMDKGAWPGIIGENIVINYLVQ